MRELTKTLINKEIHRKLNNYLGAKMSKLQIFSLKI